MPYTPIFRQFITLLKAAQSPKLQVAHNEFVTCWMQLLLLIKPQLYNNNNYTVRKKIDLGVVEKMPKDVNKRM